MCAIAGKVYLSGKQVRPQELKLMADELAHRGPDDEGVYISANKRVGLANRRLAIIDLSAAGHQPMSYLKRYWITYNGEVYNFQQERDKLIRLGYRFRSRTDTEVILALYDKYKEGCVDRLRGMWAMAIWDEKDQTLFLSRDRLGKKPLKYFFKDGVFIFASELKALLTQPEVKREPDWLAIHHYLTYGYCPSPLTGFVDIAKLEPGHYLKLHLTTGRLTKNRYWHLDFSPKLVLSKAQWQEKILAELEEATRLRMTADVPIGAFLSGGTDSSAIVAMMAKNSSRAVKTFTIGFAEKDYDETAHAQRIARRFNTDHRVLLAKPQSIEVLPQLATAYEEPYADSSAVVTYVVSRLAGKHVKVILNGDGGDENFAGYAHHRRLNRDFWLSQHPQWLSLGQPFALFWPRAKRFLDKQKTDVRQIYLGYKAFFTRSQKRQLYQEGLVPLTYDQASIKFWLSRCRQAHTPDVRDQILYADFVSYFTDDLLDKVDIASMAVGLEVRSPLADHRLCELAARIPFDLKVRGSQTKYIYKLALRQLLPSQNIYRKKMGFSIPLSKWFTGELKQYTLAHLLRDGSILKYLFKPEGIIDMLRTHTEKRDFGPRLWSLLMLQLWWESYFA